jgi:hypothetical protein
LSGLGHLEELILDRRGTTYQSWKQIQAATTIRRIALFEADLSSKRGTFLRNAERLAGVKVIGTMPPATERHRSPRPHPPALVDRIVAAGPGPGAPGQEPCT